MHRCQWHENAIAIANGMKGKKKQMSVHVVKQNHRRRRDGRWKELFFPSLFTRTWLNQWGHFCQIKQGLAAAHTDIQALCVGDKQPTVA